MIELTFNVPLFSKARPRVTTNGVFMPKQYMVNRRAMISQMKEQYEGQPLEGPLRLELNLFGEGRGDADNILGSLLDAGNGILWVDDRVSIISEIEVTWEKAKKIDSKWMLKIISIQ